MEQMAEAKDQNHGHEDEKQKLDRIVVRFGKSLNMDVSQHNLPPINGVEPLGESWLSLGYFDTMQIYPLQVNSKKGESGNWLRAIRKHNISLSESLDGNFYAHPLHLFEDLSDEKKEKKYKDFWDRESSYLFVTMIQGTPKESKAINSDALERDIGKRLGSTQSTVDYVFYRTLELSDLVVIWKANTMLAILQRVQELFYQPYIGDLNTFCGINYQQVEKKALHNENYTVPHVAMRFIIRDVSLAEKTFQKISDLVPTRPHLVTAIEDIHAVWQDMKEYELCRILYRCFIAGSEYDELRRMVKDAFWETETHIGIDLEPYPSGLKPRSVLDSPMTQKCRALYDMFARIVPSGRTEENEQYYSWMKTVRGQLNEMLDMSRNYVVDGLCCLLLDSVSLFCKEVQGRLTRSACLTSDELEQIQCFIRGWGLVMEQAGRMDGRFKRQPGFSTPLYDIPSSLLELYLAFTKLCGQILQNGGMDRCSFAVLLVPKQCRRIKVKPIFDNPSPSCSPILCVDIPLDLLYAPFTVLCQLAHEISHFCGNTLRCREERKDTFLYICAYEIATALGLETLDSINKIKNDLSGEIGNSLNNDETLYLKPFKNNMCSAIWKLLNDDQQFESWMNICEKGLKTTEPWQIYSWKEWCLAHRAILLSGGKRGHIYQLIEKFSELFRECYADISMIRMLELSAAEYFALVEQEIHLLYKPLLEADEIPQGVNLSGYYMIVQRWTIVYEAVFGTVSQIEISEKAYLKKFKEDLIQCEKFILGSLEDDNAIKTQFLNAQSLLLLKCYLEICDGELRKTALLTGGTGGDVQLLREAFNQIARNYVIACPSCNKMVAKYESTIC